MGDEEGLGGVLVVLGWNVNNSGGTVDKMGDLWIGWAVNIAGRNINNLRYADETTLMAESEKELKSLLMKVKEDSVKVGLKLNI